jgi:hypothetical protein
MNYKAQPKSKDTPSRRSRKSGRNASFRYNRELRGKLNRERRAQKEELNND